MVHLSDDASYDKSPSSVSVAFTSASSLIDFAERFTFEEAFPETSFLYRSVSNNKNNPYLS